MTSNNDQDDDMLSVREVCIFFGGKKKPLDQSTIWRWVRAGKLAPAIRMSPLVVRWKLSDCKKALAEMEKR